MASLVIIDRKLCTGHDIFHTRRLRAFQNNIMVAQVACPIINYDGDPFITVFYNRVRSSSLTLFKSGFTDCANKHKAQCLDLFAAPLRDCAFCTLQV